MVERTATDSGEEESLEPPRRTYEKQAVSDVAPASGLRPPADATPHIETDTASDDDEPQPRGLTASAISKRADHSDADVSSSAISVRPSGDIREHSPRRRWQILTMRWPAGCGPAAGIGIVRSTGSTRACGIRSNDAFGNDGTTVSTGRTRSLAEAPATDSAA